MATTPQDPMPGRDADYTEVAEQSLGGGPGAPVRRGHPKGLYLLFVTEMWERFSYYGMRALLFLYMTRTVAEGGLGWTTEKSGSLYGWYTGLVYLTPIFGGMLADRWLGTHRSMVIGGIIIAIGHFVLAFETPLSFYMGLLCIIIGTGFFKPCVSTMVGQLYEPTDGRKDAAFTIFYMGINLGAFLGPIVCGWLRVNYGWSYGFGAAGVGMVFGLIAYFLGRPAFLKGIGLPPAETRANAPVIGDRITIDAECPACGYNVKGLATSGRCPECGGAVRDAVDPNRPLTRAEWHRMWAILLMSFFVIFFWTGFELAGSAMSVFAEEQTDRSLPGSLAKLGDANGNAPAEWFQSVNPLFILTLAPIFAMIWVKLAKRGREPSTPVKFGLGLILLGLGFVMMVLGAQAYEAGAGVVRVSAFYLLAAYFLHTVGELCLSPVGLSMVTKLAPVKFASLLMGAWFLANFAANKTSGVLAGSVNAIGQKTVKIGGFTMSGEPLFYSIFVVAPIAVGIVVLILSPWIRKLMHGRA